MSGDDLFGQSWSALILDEIDDYEAIRALTEHLADHPSNASAYNNRGIAYWEIGELGLALEDLGEAIRHAGADALPAKHRAMLRREMGDLPGALADFDQAVAIGPDEPDVRRARAFARIGSGDLAGAVEDFDRAIELEPGFRQTDRDRAAVLERLGESHRARRDREAPDRPDGPE
jgi:Flp pilus assembly protein TadD